MSAPLVTPLPPLLSVFCDCSTYLLPRERPSSTAVVAQRMRVALAMIANVQIVVEKLAAQHGGPRTRRQAIVYLETLKALARLLLLACTREMVMGGGSVSVPLY